MTTAAPIYLNNAGTSWPKPPVVAEAVADTLAADPRAHEAIFDRARAVIAGFFGVAAPTQLLLTPACTSALTVALENLPWETGDVVVTSSLEHHALIRPIEALARLRGVVHRVIGYRPGRPFDLDELADALAGGRVRVVAVTAASNVTGELLPVREIVALARRRGALSLIDGAQTAGLAPLAVDALGADMLTFAGHKAPLGPQGIGGLWIGDGVKFAATSARCLAGACVVSGAPPSYCDTGSVPLAAAAGLAASLSWLQAAAPSPWEHARGLAVALRAGLRARERCVIFGGDGPHTAAVSLQLPDLPLARAEAFFRERGLLVRAGRHCAPLALRALGCPEGTIRVSFGPFNRASDVAAILAAIDEALASRAP
ncbi:MAG: aminotransferase class V-fold PLP-dependent enzyme [Myxococcales bacterium]|nr:aminotransferase class V-fold PLP-dependent enzyme [Myxococcales bacterium]